MWPVSSSWIDEAMRDAEPWITEVGIAWRYKPGTPEKVKDEHKKARSEWLKIIHAAGARRG